MCKNTDVGRFGLEVLSSPLITKKRVYFRIMFEPLQKQGSFSNLKRAQKNKTVTGPFQKLSLLLYTLDPSLRNKSAGQVGVVKSKALVRDKRKGLKYQQQKLEESS